FSKQDAVRKCESDLNALYSDWRAKFPRKTRSELFAMIAYQYASFFHELSERYASLSSTLRSTSESLDELLARKPDDLDSDGRHDIR
ncbi:MAG: cell division protein ZapA, partial [Muribaculaceae bacterium]|nr:cell division protein ZapA [Muribaculaceae bacterium]